MHSNASRYPEHMRWAIERWEKITGDPVDELTAAMLEDVLQEHRKMLSDQVRGITVGPIFKEYDGIRERDLRAERMGRSLIETCAATVLGRFGLMPRQQEYKGRPVQDVPLPEVTDHEF